MKPIIFSTPMVQAILAGQKTQTRQVMRWKPYREGDKVNYSFSGMSLGHYCTGVPESGFVLYSRGAGGTWHQRTKPIHAPYHPGDILWVRETWQSFFPEEVTEKHQRGARSFSGIPAETAKGHYMYFYYRADGEMENAGEKANWRPSVHMPKEAARIFLRVTDIRAERLQEITEEGAVVEGFVPVPCDHFGMTVWGCTDCGNTGVSEPALLKFVETWDSLNAKRGHGWDKNPWVWVIEFERDESQ